MFLNKNVIGEYLTFYRDFELTTNFGDGESISVTPYKFGYLITHYKNDTADDQSFADTWDQAISKFGEMTEKHINECISKRRTNEQKTTSKYEQMELPF